MTPFVTMRRALSDRHLLGAAQGGDSWLSWRILLIAAMGEALTDEERAISHKAYGPRARAVRASRRIVVHHRTTRRQIESHCGAVFVYLAAMVDYRARLTWRARPRVVPGSDARAGGSYGYVVPLQGWIREFNSTMRR